MYSLEVNFLKDRPIYQPKPTKNLGIKFPTGDMTPVYLGVALGVCFPALVGGGWWFLQAKNGELEQKISQLEQESQQLDTQIGNIKKIQEETNQIKGETQSLITVFDQIRPWSAILQDLRDRIPGTVQIQNIKQIQPTAPVQGKPAPNPAGGIEVTGLARSFNDVNDFLLTLQQSPFLKSSDSKIMTATLVDAPLPPNAPTSNNGVVIKPPQVVNYTIKSSLSNVPATELIRELEQKGTVGLVTRLRSMPVTGVMQK
ncbi:MAG: PilN domain-containing protein [Gloeotrichia echinulata IR180]|jgi:type IV pilus assembly protein PilN|nr:PilN domain-containing protein [Gloeotrichia echinulata DEX184]